MTAIAKWADIDKTLAELLLLMLGSPDLEVGMSMFQALNSGEAKRAALLAAAAEALKDRADDHNLFRAVLHTTSSSRDRRNEFAHHLWGTAKELPDALLLVDPRAAIKQRTLAEAYALRENSPDDKIWFGTMFELPPSQFIDRRKIQVFSRPTLAAEASAADQARKHVVLLSFALDRRKFGDQKADQMRAMLLSAPQVRREFQRLTIESMKLIRTRRLQKSREKQQLSPRSERKAQRKALWKKKT
jgi:hypothetical protein